MFLRKELQRETRAESSSQHSNHSRYSHVAKSDVPRDELNEILDGLEAKTAVLALIPASFIAGGDR